MKLWKRKTPTSLWRWNSNVRITATHIDGTVEVEWLHNLITNNGLNMVSKELAGISGLNDIYIKYLAWGDGDTAVNVSQGYLSSETGRKQITSAAATGSGKVEIITIINNDEAVGTIEELGWFAGTAATATANTGVMVARVLYSRTKTNLESLQIDRIDTFAEV